MCRPLALAGLEGVSCVVGGMSSCLSGPCIPEFDLGCFLHSPEHLSCWSRMQCASFRFMWSKNVLLICLSKSMVDIMTWFWHLSLLSSPVVDICHFVYLLEHFNGKLVGVVLIWFSSFQSSFCFVHDPRLAMLIYMNKTSFLQFNYRQRTIILFVPIISVVVCSFSLKSASHNSEILQTLIWSVAVLWGIRVIHNLRCLYYMQY